MNASRQSENSTTSSPPDYSQIQILPVSKTGATRIRKKHECIYCNSNFVNLKKHLLSVHKDEDAVKNMKHATAQNPGARSPMTDLLYAGDFKYNTDGRRNEGNLRVARVPRTVRDASEYTACVRCKKLILIVEYRKHITKCAKISGNNCRDLAILGKRLFNPCSPLADENLKKRILNHMRYDNVYKAIRYDRIIILYGNSQTSHLRGLRNQGGVVTKMRRLGRLKLLLKLNQLDEIFYDLPIKVIRAMEQLANPGVSIEKKSEYLKHPTVARNFFTLINEVTAIRICIAYEDRKPQIQKELEDWQKNFKTRYNTELSKPASESRGKQLREKLLNLPLTENIVILFSYVTRCCRDAYSELEADGFTKAAYLRLQNASITLLQVQNRRRPSDIQNITILNFSAMIKMDKHKAAASKEFADPHLQTFATEFGIIRTRGKLGREIRLIISPLLIVCISKLIEMRPFMEIREKNDFLFALPQSPTHEIRVANAYVVLRRFVAKITELHPDLNIENSLLTATNMRKHLATECMPLNLNEAELNGLADMMGHDIAIHKRIYQQYVPERTIPLFLRFVSAALGYDEGNNKGQECNNSDYEALQAMRVESLNQSTFADPDNGA